MVIPVHDVNPVRRTPLVTYLLVAVNVAVFLVSPLGLARLGGASPAEECTSQRFVYEYGAVPRELLAAVNGTARTPQEQVLGRQLPVTPGPPVRTPQGGEACSVVRPDFVKIPLLSAFSAMFLHGGWAHLLGNMLFLVVFGNNVEDRMGRLRFLVFYLLTGLVATYVFAASAASSTQPLVGASGAIAGVLGAYIAFYPRARVWSLVPFLFFVPLRLPAWLVLGLWFVLQWVYAQGAGMTGGSVAYLAHVAGFVVGLAYALMLARRRPGRRLRVPD